MTTRVTKADLDAVLGNLNRRLWAHGSPSRVTLERRYGYVALDEANAAGHPVRTLTTGNTAREAYDAMWNMIRALDLLPVIPDNTKEEA